MQRAGRAATDRNGEDISELDKGIIERLPSDGRRPYTQIAAELEVSEAAVRARTNRLVERRVAGVAGTETFVYLRITKQPYHWGKP